jgi:hypothetical protein
MMVRFASSWRWSVPRFSVYMSDAQHRQVLERWPDYNFSHALRRRAAEDLAADEEAPIYLCEQCGRRVRWFGRPKRRRPITP